MPAWKSFAIIFVVALAIWGGGQAFEAARGTTARVGTDVIDVETADPEMNAAIRKARATLANFWRAFEQPGPQENGFSLKVRLATRGANGEHIWVGSIEKQGPGKYSGRLQNDPRDLPRLRRGDRIDFEDSQISDWTYMRNGKIVGNETMRPILSRLPKEEAEHYRAMLEQP